MGVMRRNLLLALALLSLTSIQVNAAVTVEQMTEPDYIINSGYSESTAEEILLLKHRVNGQPAEPVYDNHNKFVRFCRNVWGNFIDPAQDNDERIHHNIHMSSSPRDL